MDFLDQYEHFFVENKTIYSLSGGNGFITLHNFDFNCFSYVIYLHGTKFVFANGEMVDFEKYKPKVVNKSRVVLATSSKSIAIPVEYINCVVTNDFKKFTNTMKEGTIAIFTDCIFED